jgi:outer membrane protein
MSRSTCRLLVAVGLVALAAGPPAWAGPFRILRDLKSVEDEAARDRDARRAAALERGLADAEPAVRLDGRLSLEDAVKLALVHNRALEAVLEERTRARGQVLEAWGEALPQVDLDASYERAEEALAFEFEGMRVPLGYLNNYAVDLSVTQPVYQGGRAAAALRASRFYQQYADETVRRAMQDTIYATAAGYYRVLLLDEQVRVADHLAELAGAMLKDTETKRKFGVASDFNVLRAQVERSNARARLINVRNERELAQADLFRVMGVSQASRVELTDRLEYRPEPVREEEAALRALSLRPDLAEAQYVVRLQGEALKVALSDYYPSVDVYFRNRWARPDPQISTLDEWGRVWRAGVTVKFNLFDGFRRRGKVVQERAGLKQAQIDLLDARERALYEVRSAVARLEDAAEAVETQRLTREQAVEGLRLAEVGYREGTLDQVSVLEARTALTQAQVLYYTSLYDHSLARLALEKATGALGPRDAPR